MSNIITDALQDAAKRYADVQFVDNSDPDKKDKSFLERVKLIELLPQDKEAAIRAAMITGAAAGALTLANRLFRRSVAPNGQLVDAPKYIHYDTALLNTLVKLQHYRDLNPGLFGAMLEYMDHLLLVSHLLVTGKANPDSSDPVLSFLSYRLANSLLQDFCDIVRDRLPSKHAVACETFRRKIEAQLKIHQKNVMRKCSSFNTRQILDTAEAEVADAIRMYKAGQKHMNTFEIMERAIGRMKKYE